MDHDKVRRIIKAAQVEGVRVLVIAGEGEPLEDLEFGWLLETSREHGLLPYVFTNGSKLNVNGNAGLLTRHNADLLFKHRASVIIGMDSLNPEIYRELTGGGDLDVVKNNIEGCRAMFKPLIQPRDGCRVGSLAINMVVTKLNYHEIEEMRKFCGTDIVFVCNEPTCIGRAEKNWERLNGRNLSVDVDITKIMEEMSAVQKPLGTTSNGEWCAYMRNGVSVSSDGQIITCAYSLETAGGYTPADSLRAANREVVTSIDGFYRTHGHYRCVLRHPQYAEFASGLPGKNGRTTKA